MAVVKDLVGEVGSRDRSFRPMLILTALGIVFGDIGTSPLYAFKAAMDASGGNDVNTIMGIVSLIFWSLTIVISIEYVHFVMRADNDGEGGILALAGLLTKERHRPIIMVISLIGAVLLYGDGIITPAISVLSALEGLNTAEPLFKPFVMPITVMILLGFFVLQRRGTATIAKLFGPIMLLFFCVMLFFGLRSVILTPEILAAINPKYAVHFIIQNIGISMVVVGAVFLAVTGGEALYADMGHIGRRPITHAWFFVVFPALMINYFGQGALLLRHLGSPVVNPFYELVPSDWVIPFVVLSTFASIIASQAIISGVFSLTKQAIALGRLPRLKIIQTSGSEYGQIYLPAVNFLMAVGTNSPGGFFQTFRESRGCLWDRCERHDAHHDLAAVRRHAPYLALEPVVELDHRRLLWILGLHVFSVKPDQVLRRGLVAADDRSPALWNHGRLAKGYQCLFATNSPNG